MKVRKKYEVTIVPERYVKEVVVEYDDQDENVDPFEMAVDIVWDRWRATANSCDALDLIDDFGVDEVGEAGDNEAADKL